MKKLSYETLKEQNYSDIFWKMHGTCFSLVKVTSSCIR